MLFKFLPTLISIAFEHHKSSKMASEERAKLCVVHTVPWFDVSQVVVGEGVDAIAQSDSPPHP